MIVKKPRRACVFVLVALLLPALAACGGSGVSKDQVPTSVTLGCMPALDGVVGGGGATYTTTWIRVGDFDCTENGSGWRGFFCFSLESIPGDAVVESATLRIYQEEVSSASPFAQHGGLLVDLVGVGGELDGDDYDVGALYEGIGVLTASDALGWKTLDVRAEVQNGLDSLRNRADFRLRFANFDSNSDHVCNWVGLNDSGDAFQSGNVPELQVTWRRP